MKHTDYDAVVVGSGPNGLSAAIRLQQRGLSVLLLEGSGTIGGGMRTAGYTLPGFSHDVCSAIHPMAAASPYWQTLPLHEYGLTFLHPEVYCAHPFDDGTSAFLTKSLADTAASLGEDRSAYINFIAPIVQNWHKIAPDVLAPFSFPSHPIAMATFGINALLPATVSAKRFATEKAKGFWAGMAAHSILPLSKPTTSAIGIVLAAAGHLGGWPLPKGGSQAMANALASYFISLKGKIETNTHITSLKQLPPSKIVLFDVSPRQLLKIAGQDLSAIYRWQLGRYRYGMGVFKVDWAIEGQVPFKDEASRKAGTVHIGGTLGEIALSEKDTWQGRHPERPFVLLAQQGLIDPSRAPEGKQAVWGYCHVPHGSTKDMTEAIERQVERFAPGFRERILARHTLNTAQMEAYNPNYIGGDVNGGVIDLGQIFTRPALRYSPYRTSAKGLYICSASTPPGGGVHGMCGFHAAERALNDLFK